MAIRCRLASAEDEPLLGAILAGCPMPGSIRLAFERAPEWARALDAQGTTHQTILAEEAGEILGMGVRALWPGQVNGRPMELGYLGGLRTLEKARGSAALARGFRLLRELHQDGRVPGYLTTILEANRGAQAMLTGDRPSLPRYLDLGRVTTYAILPGRRRRRPAPPGIELGRGEEGCLPEILGFLTACGRRRQFGAAFGTSLDPASHFRDFQAGDFYLARKDGRLVGAVGVWDQRAFRRTRVTGYAPWLAPLRPLLDFLLRASGHAGLPPPGAHLDEAYLAFRGVEGDDPAILAALLESIVQDRAGGSCHALLTTFHERDPLAAALGPFRTIPCRARLFWVCWDEGMPFFQALDPALVPALEAARL